MGGGSGYTNETEVEPHAQARGTLWVKRRHTGCALGSARSQERSVTVKGYVLDSACAFIKSLQKLVSRACAPKCAKAGSPLVILGDDGTSYWPISDSMPATGQNQRLMKFAGQKVTVRGKVFDKGGRAHW